MTPLFFIGDSHSGWYRRGAIRAGRNEFLGGPLVSAINIQDDFFEFNGTDFEFKGQAGINFEKYKRNNEIDSLMPLKRSLVVSIGLHSAHFYGNATFRRRFSFSPESRPERRILSRSLIRQIVLDKQRHALRFYEYLAAHDLIFGVIETPRPQRRHQVVEALGGEKVLELARIWEQPIRNKLAELGYTVLVPDGTVDDDGFLKAKYWAEDTAHANLDYADIVLDLLHAKLAHAHSAR